MSEPALVFEPYLPSRAQRRKRTAILVALYLFAALRYAVIATMTLIATFAVIAAAISPVLAMAFPMMGVGVFLVPVVMVACSLPFGLLLTLRQIPRQRRGYAEAVWERSGATNGSEQDQAQLRALLEPLAIAAGCEVPHVGVIPSLARNAMSVSPEQGEAFMAVTHGLLQLPRREVEAVLAWQMTQLAAGEVAFVTRVLALTGAAAKRRKWRSYRGKNTNSLVVDGFSTEEIINSPAVSGSGRHRLRRWALKGWARRCDVAALSFTRDPQSLADALRSILENPGEPMTLEPADAPLWLDYPKGVTVGTTLATRIAMLDPSGPTPEGFIPQVIKHSTPLLPTESRGEVEDPYAF